MLLNTDIHLDEVSNKERYDRVTVNAKVLMVSPKAQISDGLWKQVPRPF